MRCVQCRASFAVHHPRRPADALGRRPNRKVPLGCRRWSHLDRAGACMAATKTSSSEAYAPVASSSRINRSSMGGEKIRHRHTPLFSRSQTGPPYSTNRRLFSIRVRGGGKAEATRLAPHGLGRLWRPRGRIPHTQCAEAGTRRVPDTPRDLLTCTCAGVNMGGCFPEHAQTRG